MSGSSEASRSRQRIRVLCLDDDPATNRLHALVLQQERDIEVVGELLEADGAFEAIARHDPDVVLLDLRMSGESTLPTCARLRERFPHLGILALSGFGHPEMIEDVLRAGASGYVVKASDIDRLAPAIRRVARGEKLGMPGLEQGGE